MDRVTDSRRMIDALAQADLSRMGDRRNAMPVTVPSDQLADET